MVKELEIALHPADLGLVTIKMRLAKGKLSVVISTASATTRVAIENQRDAIADRLSASQCAREDLTIQQAGPAFNAETSDAVDTSANQPQANPRDDPSLGRGAFAREATSREQPQARRGLGDFVV